MLATPRETRGAFEAMLNSVSQVQSLTEDDRDEVLTFLSARPLHTVIMAGWILDHGVVSPLHRGTFYGYRDRAGDLQGVALIGKNTLFEIRTEEAWVALANKARDCPEIKMVMAEEELLSNFWRYYAASDISPRLTHRELLFETRPRLDKNAAVEHLRPATSLDLDLVVAAHAEMVAEETGINPLETDAQGFRDRCAARVERGRVWVWREGNELIFKTDVLTQAAGISYIEGVWVNPTHRGRGICGRGLAALHQKLLATAETVCCFAEAENPSVRSLYLQAGYSQQGIYSKIYL